MFDLDEAIQHWKRSLKGKCPVEDIEELETHLTEHIKTLTESGVKPEDAFSKAIDIMGDPHELGREFAKVRTFGDWIHERLQAIDWILFLALSLICGLGVAILFSAASSDPMLPSKMWIKQTLFVGFGFLAMFLFAQIKPNRLKRIVPYIYGTAIFLLTVNLFAGEGYAGDHRKMDLGVILFQPTALVPLAVPMMVAWILTKRSFADTWKGFATMLAAILVPTLLILLQPDVGMALICVVAGWLVLFLSPYQARLLKVSCFVVPVMVIAAFVQLKPYQQQRIEVQLHPEAAPERAGWHALQVKKAVNSGGFLGRGWLNAGTEVPNKHKDFILTLVAEQFGTLGVLVVMSCFGALLYRAIAISKRSLDPFGRSLGFGFAGILALQLFVNLGVIYGWIPLIGVPLPLISLGGTSIIILLIGFGILASIRRDSEFVALS